MQRALDFLKNHVELLSLPAKAIVRHIRIFQIMKMEDSTLFFATSPEKEVYRQLLENPFVEIMANEGKEFVKVNGKADFGWMKKLQKWIYEHNPVLPRLYTSFDKLAYFKVEIAEMDHVRPHVHASDVQALQSEGAYGEPQQTPHAESLTRCAAC